jgi:FLYWCH zinc finger domain/MULE transposase domain
MIVLKISDIFFFSINWRKLIHLFHRFISELTDKRLSYVDSTHGKQQLLFNGARFCVKQTNKNSILWRCVKSTCSASVTISNEGKMLRTNEMHNHLFEPNETKFLELRHKLKKEAQTTSIPIDRIVETAYSEMIVEGNITDSVIKFPTIKTLKNTVNKQRRKSRPAIPKSIANIPYPIPLLYGLTKQNLDFLLYDGQLGENRGLIFSSIEDIRYLANQKYWYADGTFYTSPSIFYQIYSIHAFDEGLSTPCVFVLLADKQEKTYDDLFTKLIAKMRELCQAVQLQSITIDYELAVKNVFNKNFPHLNVRKTKEICFLY